MDCGDIVFKNGGYGNTGKEVRLRLRMKALNISVYEPNPVEAIEKAEHNRRTTRRNGRELPPEGPPPVS
jgi:hypothetical protein